MATHSVKHNRYHVVRLSDDEPFQVRDRQSFRDSRIMGHFETKAAALRAAKELNEKDGWR